MVRSLRDAGPGEGAVQRGERQQHQVVPLADVRPLVREHRRELGLVEQVQRPGADHDAGPQPRHAVRRGGRVIEHQRTRRLRVAASEQCEQRAVPAPGAQPGGAGGGQHPAQQREQRDRGGECGQPQHQQGHRLVAGCPGPRDGSRCERHDPAGHAGVLRPGRQRGQRAHRGQAPAQAERLPEHDRGGGRPARPRRGGEHGGRGHGGQGDRGEDENRREHSELSPPVGGRTRPARCAAPWPRSR